MPSGKDYPNLTEGSHEFIVRGFDFSTFSNVQASDTFVVEAAAPPPPPPPTPVCADARIQSITPNPVAEGESIQLRGIYLDKTIGVTLNGKALEIQSKTASSIMAVIPKGAVSGLVKLVCADGEQDDGTPITVTQPNLPPVPNAVAKAKSKLSRTFAVDASLSFDPDKDGKIVAYKWSYKGKTLSRKMVFNYRVPSSVKSRTLLLTVVDDQGASASARVKLVPRVAQPTVVTLPGGNFGFDKFRLSKRGKATLVKARKYARGSHALLIETGASSEGSISYNRRLTQRRARSVKKVLLQGISNKSRPRKVTLRALGETHPVASNRTSRGRYLNRFARLTIYP
jgi:outer membrane protein OmpA-like peptidoglycan-associated protein